MAGKGPGGINGALAAGDGREGRGKGARGVGQNDDKGAGNLRNITHHAVNEEENNTVT